MSSRHAKQGRMESFFRTYASRINYFRSPGLKPHKKWVPGPAILPPGFTGSMTKRMNTMKMIVPTCHARKDRRICEEYREMKGGKVDSEMLKERKLGAWKGCLLNAVVSVDGWWITRTSKQKHSKRGREGGGIVHYVDTASCVIFARSED